jgi:hypothetical protein
VRRVTYTGEWGADPAERGEAVWGDVVTVTAFLALIQTIQSGLIGPPTGYMIIIHPIIGKVAYESIKDKSRFVSHHEGAVYWEAYTGQWGQV